MPNALERKLTALYDEIGLGSCEICTRCRAEAPDRYPKAVGCWFVGSEYARQDKRVLFVGKTARGLPASGYAENQNEKGYLEEFRYTRDGLWDEGWAYWRYTREICQALFGPVGMEAAAFTNMVKCNGSDTVDTTTDSMRDHCIRELRVIQREIEVIEPTHVVCYTGERYDPWLADLFDALELREATEIPVGKKRMPFADLDAVSKGRSIRVLRVGHPERKRKDAFVSAVVGWIHGAAGPSAARAGETGAT